MLGRLKAYRESHGEVERLRNELAEAQEILRDQRERLRDLQLEPFDASKMIWIFGTGRSGSTWLASMLGDLEGGAVWSEPLVGELFGNLYYVRASERHHGNSHFILGKHKESWLGSVRNFVLREAAARFSTPGEGDHLVIKEPNGSVGAPLLMEALPESRMVLLIRDPRDVAASALDASKKGGWRHEAVAKKGNPALVRDDLDAFVERWAHVYLRHAGNAARAYEAHEGPKALVRYEDLVADTSGEIERMYEDLAVPSDGEELARVVEKHSWGNIPEEKKGEGKFYRKGTPGSWREDLAPEQAKTVERVTTPMLEQFYPE